MAASEAAEISRTWISARSNEDQVEQDNIDFEHNPCQQFTSFDTDVVSVDSKRPGCLSAVSGLDSALSGRTTQGCRKHTHTHTKFVAHHCRFRLLFR